MEGGVRQGPVTWPVTRLCTFGSHYLPFQLWSTLAHGAAWARWPSPSSKRVRSYSPRLGRFDSGAAPLNDPEEFVSLR